jgi:uncharacterized repeat protein (TIGR03803 family)
MRLVLRIVQLGIEMADARSMTGSSRQLVWGSLLLLSSVLASFAGSGGIVFHPFTSLTNGVNPDGANPAAGLVLAGGFLTGTTLSGGTQAFGTAYHLSADGSGFQAFHSFAGPSDGANPQGELVAFGISFLGTTLGGGSSCVGTVFLGQTNGSVSIVHSFTSVQADTATNSEGASPTALLAMLGTTVYGTTTAGGSSANGTVFSCNTNGSVSVLHNFIVLDSGAGTNSDGAFPRGGLILSGGTLYGTASEGGSGGVGVVFCVSTNGGGFTNLHSFAALDSQTATNADGAIPLSGLTVANGALYGTTVAGGQGGNGTVFSIGTNGLGFTVLHHFSSTDPLTGTNADGASPCAPLTLSGGLLYGTAAKGGVGGNGVVFSVSTNGGQFQTLYSFTATDPIAGTNGDGALPLAGLLQGGNSLYGTTFAGGPGAAGTVFGLVLPLPPPAITRITANPDGSVNLFFSSAANSTNVIQAASSLAAPVMWINISTNVADAGGHWQFTDSNTSPPARFYRCYAIQ